jgi:hypothetical protein
VASTQQALNHVGSHPAKSNHRNLHEFHPKLIKLALLNRLPSRFNGEVELAQC